MPFFSNVSLVWSFCDSYCLALILIMVLKYMFRFFRFCSVRSWFGSDYVSYVLVTPFWVEFRNLFLDFSTFLFCFLRWNRCGSNYLALVWIDSTFKSSFSLICNIWFSLIYFCRSDYVAYVWLIQSGSSFEVRFSILFRFCFCVSRWCECESENFALGLLGSSWQSLILDFQSWR